MLSTSIEFREKIAENANVLVKATLTLADSTVVDLAGDDFVMGGMSFSSSTSDDTSFSIGAAVTGKLDVDLNNADGRFDDYDFTGATIVPYIGVDLGAGKVEWLRKGIFDVEQPDSYSGTVHLECLDMMARLDRPYSQVLTVYPATLGAIVGSICTACGVTLKRQDFANYTYLVAQRPDDSALSCHDVISYAAQASGNFARCDQWGRLELAWYDTAAYESEDHLDGKTFDSSTPYASGDDADGGDFLDYTSGDDADGGDFESRRFALLHAISGLTVCTDDVVVTGVRVTASDERNGDGTIGRAGESYLSGSSGYVLDISDNPLVQYGRASAVAAMVGLRAIGMRFRPFDVSALGDPSIEAGDPVVVIDRKSNQYFGFITSLDYRVGRLASVRCQAETPARNSASSFGALTKAAVAARNAARAEMTSREAALQLLSMMLGGASGLYCTADVQQDGSSVYYLHDKSTLAASTTIWKVTADAFGVSTDGGATYSYGIDSNGVAILNRIYASGIDADYIQAGTISDRAGKYTWDLETGVFTALDNLGMCVRPYGSGVLVCSNGNTIGALVNSAGSFDIVSVTWANGVPTAGSAITSLGSVLRFGDADFGMEMGDGYIRFKMEGERALDLAYTPATTPGGTNWDMSLDFMQGLLQCIASGYRNKLTTEGYPLIFKSGNELCYWSGSTTSPTVFPISQSGQSNTRIPSAIHAWPIASGVYKDLYINGLFTMMAEELVTDSDYNYSNGALGTEDVTIAEIRDIAYCPIKDLIVPAVATDYPNGGNIYPGYLTIYSEGYIDSNFNIRTAKRLRIYLSATWLRNG